MGLVLLVLFYLALAAALATVASRLGRTPSLWATLVLTLLPLVFTVRGFLPGLTLAPTGLMTGVPPWADPGRWVVMEEEPDPNPLLLDPLSQFIPWSRAARDDLLFNPAQGGGAALLGNGQSAALFPTEVISRGLPPFRALTFSQAARLLVAGWGMYLLAAALLGAAGGRRRELDGSAALGVEMASLVAAAAYVGCGFLELWRLHPHSLVAASAPWVVFGLVWLVRRPGPRPAVTLAVAGAAGVAGGHPETLLHTLLFALLAAAVVWAAERAAAPRDVGSPGPLLLHGEAAALLAVLLAAPVLLPFVDNLRVSAEWEFRSDAGTVVELPLERSLTRLRPAFALYALGDPVAGNWTGPENLAELGGGSLGVAALVLALLALAGGGPHRRWLAALLLTVGLVGLAVSVHTPGISRPFGAVPLLRESLLKRLSLWWVLAGSLLAAVGFEVWWRRGGETRMRLAALAAVLAVALAVAWAGGPPGAPGTGWEWGTLAAVALLLLAGPRWRPGGVAVAAGLLLVALLLPRAALFARWVPAVSAAGFYAETPSTRYVAQRLAESDAGWRVAGLQAALVPHSAAFFGFPEVRAYDPMTFAPYQRFQTLTGEAQRIGWPTVRDPASPALAFLGARFVFENPQQGERDGVEVVFRGPGALVYENRAALPRAYVPPEVEVFGSADEALAAAEGIDDFARRVTLSGLDVGPLPFGTGRTLPSGPARVEELTVERRRLRAVVLAEAAALVATSQPAIPGWRLRLDGDEVEGVRVNGAFLGAVVQPGRHTLEMTYAPASWRWGMGSFVSGLLLAVGWLLLDLRRRQSQDG